MIPLVDRVVPNAIFSVSFADKSGALRKSVRAAHTADQAVAETTETVAVVVIGLRTVDKIDSSSAFCRKR